MKKVIKYSMLVVGFTCMIYGCTMPNGGDITINCQMFTTRSAVASTNCVAGIEGGGTTDVTGTVPLK